MGVIEPALGKGPRKKSLAEIREISGDWCYSGCPRTQFLRGIGVIVTIDSGVITTCYNHPSACRFLRELCSSSSIVL